MTIIPELSISPSALSVFASCILRLHCLMFLTPHIFLWTLLASFLFASIAIAIPVIYSVQQLPVTYFLTNILEIGLSLFSKLWEESQTDRLYQKKGEKLPSRSTSNDSLRMDCSEELQTYSGLFRDNLLVFTSLMVLRWFFFKIITEKKKKDYYRVTFYFQLLPPPPFFFLRKTWPILIQVSI